MLRRIMNGGRNDPNMTDSRPRCVPTGVPGCAGADRVAEREEETSEGEHHDEEGAGHSVIEGSIR